MPTKVAILGGGMGALAAAWKLSDPSLGGLYEVTVYQRDGLLGGKGASTRNADPALNGRIEEHGIHVLMGFYDNALTLLEECYAELDASGVPGTLPWGNVLTPWDEVTLSADTPAGWDFQSIPFPTNGEPFGGDGTPSYVPSLVANGVAWFVFFLTELGAGISLPTISMLKTIIPWFMKFLVFLGSLGVPVSWLFGLVKWWIDLVISAVWPLVLPLVSVDPRVRWLWVGLWFAGTNLRGLIDENIMAPPHDFDGMNGQDYKVWLQNQSVVSPPPEFSWDSPPVQATYDIAFSYGHPLEAGVVLYNLLLIALGYKQHFSFRMNAGMGEAVFMPLHHALDARGVQFEFFSTVTDVRGDYDGYGNLKVEEIDVSMPVPAFAAPELFGEHEVELNDGTTTSIHAWVGGEIDAAETIPHTLMKGADFDLVVLGISVGALEGICPDLAAKDPAFNQMLALRALPTQSAQLWLDKDLTQLGWTGGALPGVVSFARPFQSWLDMSQVLKREPWTAPEPKAVVYFSDEYKLDTTGTPPDDVVWQRLVNFVTNDIPLIWPAYANDELHAPTGMTGLDRLRRQYWRANLDPSDQYVICHVGTNSLRLPADGAAFQNLALAGDWVKTHLNTGCIESATTAGFDAASAIIDGRVFS